MIAPRKIRFEAAKKEKENFEFRIFLKCNADSEELDKQFQKLHQELFSSYDCSRCRNCCKMYRGILPEDDLEHDAACLGLSKESMIEKYLIKIEGEEGKYETKNIPCDFMNPDGSCKLGECKPENCRLFPYTDQPDRLASLYGVLEVIQVCPVALVIFDRLNDIDGWKYKRR